MRMGGWLRLWIVVTILYGFGVAAIAYIERPTLEQLQRNWVWEAADTVAAILSNTHNNKVTGREVRNQWVEGKSYANVTELLEKIESAPNDKQGLFSSEIATINTKHRQIISQLRIEQLNHFLLSLAWWLIPSLVLLALGWSMGWIIKGFRNNRT